jgi:Uma2 family endonuclease
LITLATPRTIHQRISGNLSFALSSYIKSNGLGIVVHRLDVVFSMTNILQPDILFVSGERSHIITKRNIVKAPDLIVEIISEDTKIRDQTIKKTLYEKYEVKEYWIVFPDEKKVEQFILRDEKLELKEEFTKSERITSKVIDDFSVSLEEIFAA